jgi:hypothetical protein
MQTKEKKSERQGSEINGPAPDYFESISAVIASFGPLFIVRMPTWGLAAYIFALGSDGFRGYFCLHDMAGKELKEG